MRMEQQNFQKPCFREPLTAFLCIKPELQHILDFTENWRHTKRHTKKHKNCNKANNRNRYTYGGVALCRRAGVENTVCVAHGRSKKRH